MQFSLASGDESRILRGAACKSGHTQEKMLINEHRYFRPRDMAVTRQALFIVGFLARLADEASSDSSLDKEFDVRLARYQK